MKEIGGSLSVMGSNSSFCSAMTCAFSSDPTRNISAALIIFFIDLSIFYVTKKYKQFYEISKRVIKVLIPDNCLFYSIHKVEVPHRGREFYFPVMKSCYQCD